MSWHGLLHRCCSPLCLVSVCIATAATRKEEHLSVASRYCLHKKPKKGHLCFGLVAFSAVGPAAGTPCVVPCEHAAAGSWVVDQTVHDDDDDDGGGDDGDDALWLLFWLWTCILLTSGFNLGCLVLLGDLLLVEEGVGPLLGQAI